MDKGKDIEVASKIIEDYDLFFYNQSFYEYDTNHWKPISIDKIKIIILEILEDSYKQQRVNNILDIIKLKTYKFQSEINKIDRVKAINIINGHYYLNDKKLVEHSNKTKNQYSTNVFSVNYSVDAKCERWKQFVYEIFEPDYDRHDKTCLLQEYLGYCLTQNTLFQKALLMLGTGSNGKSIIIEVMQKLLGDDNYSNIELHQFSKPNYLVEIQNKLVNFCSEIDHKNKFSTGVFKRIITGETLQGDAKFKDPIKFNPYCKLIFASNDLPITNDTTKGYFRRLLILKFNRSFEGSDRDDHLKYKLFAELDGIFNWILEGLERLYTNKEFTTPPSHLDELAKYLESSNNVVSFVNEKCEIKIGPNIYEPYDSFYAEYSEHCNEFGTHSFNKLNFKNEILKQFPQVQFKRAGERGNHFRNIQIDRKEF